MADRKSKRISRMYYNENEKSLLKQEKRRTTLQLDPDKIKKMEKKEEEKLNIVHPPRIGYEDMTKMDNMTLEAVLENLQERYVHDLIYTYTSSILVAVNPFKRLNIFTKGWVKYYKNNRIGVLPPHIYAVAEAAYSAMVEHKKNQSCLVSGESGAGKTECTKLILQFLSARTDRQSNIETMVLESVPVLEAFGNAKTSRNDNSSRFGKLIQIQFDNDYYIGGSKIIPYLLEKSRIVGQAKGERNYHIFYQLTEGATPEDREKFFLKRAADYKILNHSGCISIAGVDEAQELNQLKAAFKLFEITDEIRDNIFRVVSAVLHLCNLTFKAAGEGSTTDGEESDRNLGIAAQMLSLEKDVLLKALVSKKIQMRSEIIHKPMTPEQARDQTEALSKHLYSVMFDWIVNKLNTCTNAQTFTNFIGVLDIFGFELFEHNSFEQFLINYANEKLQQFFNHHIFKLEMAEYDREKIDYTSVEFKDNQECLDLIEQKRPPGVLSVLDEESRFPKATDETFITKLHTNFEKHVHYDKPRLAKDKFGVKHYAGLVEYNTIGWRDKNKDELPEHMIETLQKSSNRFLCIMYAAEEGTTGGSKITLGGQFKNQLVDLMGLLSGTEPYFVRCVKPNMAKVPNNFDQQLIYNQLLYAGMLETIRIRKMGFPIRYAHSDFWKRFKCICPELQQIKGEEKETASRLISALGLNTVQCQLGLTKVFLKLDVSNLLEDRRNVALTSTIIKLQQWWRMASRRETFVEKREKAVFVQQWWRMVFRRKRHLLAIEKAIEVQRWWRAVAARRLYKQLAEQKRKEEEERRRKEEEERQRRIEREGREKVEAEEREAARLKAEAEAAAIVGARDAARKSIRFSVRFLEQEDEKKKKEEEEDDELESAVGADSAEGAAAAAAAAKEEEKKKKKKEKFKRDKRGSIIVKKDMQLDVPLHLDTKILLGIGWKGGQWDMDASCLLFRYQTHIDDVYYYKPRSKDGSVTHRGGAAGTIRSKAVDDEDAEQMEINLLKVSPKTTTLIFVVTVFSPEGNFMNIKDPYIRLVDLSNGKEYCRYTLDDSGSETAKIMCKMYRYGFSKWRLKAIGEPSEGRLYKQMIPKVLPFLDPEPPKRTIKIKVHRGKFTDIESIYKGEEAKGLNTYCEILFDIDRSKTKTVKKSLTPGWKSTRELTGQSTVLEILIFHKALLSREQLIGRLMINCPEGINVKEKWYKMEERLKGETKRAITGEIKLSILDTTL